MRKVFYSISILMGFLVFSFCSKDDDNKTVVADFTYTGGDSPAPCSVLFENKSQNAFSYSWDFGDGTTSTEENPSKVYTSNGSFLVMLKATNAVGYNTITKIANIASAPTSVDVDSVSITAMPFLNANSAGWDSSNGSDVFFNIVDQSNSVLYNGENYVIYNVSTSELPLKWELSTPFAITDFNSSRIIDIWDMDQEPIDANDKIGSVSFLMSDYTSGSNNYPTSISKTQDGISVTLWLTWKSK